MVEGARGRLSRWRLRARVPVGFPQQHSGRVVVLAGRSGRLPRLSVLRRAQAVVVGQDAEWPANDALIELAASGVTLVCRPGGEPRGSDASVLAVRPERRPRARTALDRSAPPRLVHRYGDEFEPSISVVLATQRAADLPNTIEMIDRQVCRPAEVMVGLHGDGFADDVVERLGGPGRSFMRYGLDVNLGEVLTDLTGRCTGALISKWDDDDWYGVHHLGDLALALRYSAADLVGKSAEFVFLEDPGITVRRMSIGAEAFSTTVAGGALMVTREALERAGGWPLTPRDVDLGLIARIERSGGRVYRTHGFEYVLRRHRAGHTWSATSSYFLAQSCEQRPGLDLAFAGIAVV